ncbi:MAG: SNF family Na+-dependent transporter [Ulvibacter sp.]|jgi:SNF family Na+-dependent transporter
MLTTMWFLTSNNWWKYAILVPLVMFLFQFLGVLNFELEYIDEFDFWYSLPIILPILFFLIYISFLISKNESNSTDLMTEVDAEIKKMLSEDL